MKDFDYDFLVEEEAEDEETIKELKSNRARNRRFAALINKRKLSRYELDELMA